ncbi:hypothetical protein AAFF_G00371400 [Aldrovandia affinis]|uniref:Uncharacterized protein n=1 Tax=Aldrovandia affinis TaxID=143900 RepID=A0AAD7SGT8_9TELE|nr:hypothetical protein AAFF_G00371400 [Aldrovandia affinis]
MIRLTPGRWREFGRPIHGSVRGPRSPPRAGAPGGPPRALLVTAHSHLLRGAALRTGPGAVWQRQMLYFA